MFRKAPLCNAVQLALARKIQGVSALANPFRCISADRLPVCHGVKFGSGESNNLRLNEVNKIEAVSGIFGLFEELKRATEISSIIRIPGVNASLLFDSGIEN